jgi:hypothetical protein
MLSRMLASRNAAGGSDSGCGAAASEDATERATMSAIVVPGRTSVAMALGLDTLLHSISLKHTDTNIIILYY